MSGPASSLEVDCDYPGAMARQRANYPNGTLLHEYEVIKGRLENQVFRVDRTQDWRRALGPLVTFDVGLLPDTAAFVRRVAGASPLAYEIFDADDARLDREGRRAGGKSTEVSRASSRA